MAVVLIIGLLSTLVGLAIFPQIDKSRVNTTRAQIKMLDAALETYRMDNSKFPTTEQGLDALVKEPEGAMNYQPGGYRRERRIPEDPWGKHNKHSYDLWSHGADGSAGGEGIDADIGNWAEDAQEG